jgi:coenzyme F420 hydrogenase subunit beta
MIADPYLGKYTTCVAARSTDKEILKKAQDGGIATALMVYALENGIIDGTIVAVRATAPGSPDRSLP